MEINKIYNEGCQETMSKMPDNFIDLVVTSPPYDDIRDYHGYSFSFEEIAKELFRILKPGGVMVWVVGDKTQNGSESLTSFRQALFFKDVVGFNIHDTMIYEKEPPPSNQNRYEQHFEYMFILSKGNPKAFNPIKEKTLSPGRVYSSTRRQKNGATKINESIRTKEIKTRGNVWKYKVGYNHTTKDDCYEHPAMFPEKLAEDHIISWSNPGDLVYDPFMGSGTTAKMSHLNKRNWIGSEISKKYHKLSLKRIDPYLRQKLLF